MPADLLTIAREVEALSESLASTFQDALAPVLTCAEAEQLARTMAALGYPETAEIILIGHSSHDGEDDWHPADQTEYDSDAQALVRQWTEGDWSASAVPDEQPDREPTPADEEGWDSREDDLRGHVLDELDESAWSPSHYVNDGVTPA